MEDYWLGVCVGWLLGLGTAWWVYRDQVKHLKNQVNVLEDYMRKLT
ncbi:hypothetical protein JNO12_12660 [Erwinia aphidicola]|nr:hypothetical protein [Erwinia aphidicola]